MLPNKKIIAFDLDQTLNISKCPITRDMASLLKEILKKKMIFVISGGNFKQFNDLFLPEFVNDLTIAPFIHNLKLLPTSGSQRYEYDETKKEWILTDKEPMDAKIRDKAKILLKGIIASGLYGIPPNPIGEIIEDRDTQVTFTPNGQEAPIALKRLWDPDRKKRERIVSILAPQLPEVDLLINGSSSIDVVPKGFTKAVGLIRLLKKLNLSKSDLIYIGDALFPGGNDYSIVEAGMDNIAVNGPEETETLIKGWLG